MSELAPAALAFRTITIATVDIEDIADHLVTCHPLNSPDLISLRCCIYDIIYVTPLLHAERYVAASQ